ncbi:MAG TPA: hypothetical protein VGC85_01915 [Chthoniobacterales bacterium]|jgi:hypothetical protein
MKKLALLFVLATALAMAAEVKTVKLPSEAFGVASIDIPDAWDVDEELDNGVSLTNADGSVYVSAVAVGNELGMDAELEYVVQDLKEHGVVLDDKSRKDRKLKINGLDADELTFQGKDDDGDASVTVSFVPVKNKFVVITYWVSTNEQKEHQAEITQLMNTLKPVG